MVRDPLLAHAGAVSDQFGQQQTTHVSAIQIAQVDCLPAKESATRCQQSPRTLLTMLMRLLATPIGIALVGQPFLDAIQQPIPKAFSSNFIPATRFASGVCTTK